MPATPCPRCGRLMDPDALTRMERVFFIHEILRHGNQVTARDFSSELDVSQRTILRDVIFMRDTLGAPIVSTLRGYHYGDCAWEMESPTKGAAQ